MKRRGNILFLKCFSNGQAWPIKRTLHPNETLAIQIPCGCSERAKFCFSTCHEKKQYQEDRDNPGPDLKGETYDISDVRRS
ncbi:hypothetical protein JHK85_050998 [Glycine max]|nr:hypothetical protein JHK85_050998 [Glycine max]